MVVAGQDVLFLILATKRSCDLHATLHWMIFFFTTMSTSNFSAIEDLGNHSDGSIYNPELSDMEVDSPEELPLPKHIAGKPLNRKRMNTNVHQGFSFFCSLSNRLFNILRSHSNPQPYCKCF